MKNSYFIDEPAVVSFSGGRTSAYMLCQILAAHDGILPDYVEVIFCNTGKEMPETLDFVDQCAHELSINIIWLECFAKRQNSGKKMYVYETREVTYKTASRKGEPFSSIIESRRYMPNPVARFCTQELKIFRMRDWMNEKHPKEDGRQVWVNIVGIRADEQRRAAKMATRSDVYLPLNIEGVTKEIVGDFWRSMPWDLGLSNNNGVTDFGNCDLCFLKGLTKKLSIIRARPDLADWWDNEETKLSEVLHKGAFFRSDQPSYGEMKRIVADQSDMFADATDESMDCFCGD